jgi:hypothetical protein
MLCRTLLHLRHTPLLSFDVYSRLKRTTSIRACPVHRAKSRKARSRAARYSLSRPRSQLCETTQTLGIERTRDDYNHAMASDPSRTPSSSKQVAKRGLNRLPTKVRLFFFDGDYVWHRMTDLALPHAPKTTRTSPGPRPGGMNSSNSQWSLASSSLATDA